MTDIPLASSSFHQPQDLYLMNPDLDFLNSLSILQTFSYKSPMSPWEPSMSEEGWLWGFSLFNGWGRETLEICRRKSAE